jgi:hypothetical protein
MADRKKKIPNGQGGEVETTVMGFQTVGEHWNEYLLTDGTVITIKSVATEILRIDGQYDPKGDPVYLINSQNIVVASSPDNLKEKK